MKKVYGRISSSSKIGWGSARETTIALVGSSTIRKPKPDVAIRFFRMKFLDREHQPIAGLERAMVIVAVKMRTIATHTAFVGPGITSPCTDHAPGSTG